MIFYENGIQLLKTSNDREQGWLNVHEWLRPYETRDEQTGETYKTANLTFDEGLDPDLWKHLTTIQKSERNPNDVATQPHELTHYCLSGDTIINTPNGDFCIKDMVGTEGDVYCYDETNKQKAISRYHSVMLTKKNVPVFAVEMDDGTIIKATQEHKFLTIEGWKQLQDLKEGDEIIKIS